MPLEIQIFNVEKKHDETHNTKNKAGMNCKLIQSSKRILLLRYIYLFKALQIQNRGDAIGVTTDKHLL